jgi:hypothetical protein
MNTGPNDNNTPTAQDYADQAIELVNNGHIGGAAEVMHIAEEMGHVESNPNLQSENLLDYAEKTGQW